MKKLGIIANLGKPDADDVLARLGAQAKKLGLALFADEATSALIPGCSAVAADRLPGEIEGLMALGGDGTMLNAVHVLGGAEIPVIGLNIGSLGFMTSITLDHLDDAMRALAEGDYTMSVRTLIDCELHSASEPPLRRIALNDVVFGWGRQPRVVSLGLSVNGEEVTSYLCDGLIVTTPTGSTGHSLSAAGPIIHPDARVFLVNVICPHTLSTRPMILPDDATIGIQAREIPEGKELLFSVDGQYSHTLRAGDVVSIRRHPAGVRFIHLPGYSYFDVLRRKLHWRGSNL